MKVLVVDDSKTVRIYHKQILKDAGFDVEEAENGMEALEKSVNNNYSLYLVDVNMPIMDGYTFVNNIRNKNNLVPIIMISTEAESIDMDKAFESGANLYFLFYHRNYF